MRAMRYSRGERRGRNKYTRGWSWKPKSDPRRNRTRKRGQSQGDKAYSGAGSSAFQYPLLLKNIRPKARGGFKERNRIRNRCRRDSQGDTSGSDHNDRFSRGKRKR